MNTKAKTPVVKKLSVNVSSATASLTHRAQDAARSRFAVADEIGKAHPNGFAPRAPAGSAPAPLAAAAGGEGFDLAACQVGMTYQVPIALIEPNPDGARVFYQPAAVDAIAESLQKHAQDEPAKGFVDGDRVVLIDGGTRLRSARAGGLPTLEVRIRAKPASRVELFCESMRMNDERSAYTALDTAFMLGKLLREGVFKSQDEIAGSIPQRDGSPMTKQLVSTYMRIAKIPERTMRLMTEHDRTSSLTVAYEISALFVQSDYAGREEHYQALAQDIIEEILSGELTKKGVIALVQSKLEGPKQRQRGEKSTLSYGKARGTLNVFRARGQLDFSLRGLDAEGCDHMSREIERMCRQAAAQG